MNSGPALPITVQLLSAVIGLVIGIVIWGVMIKLLSGPIGKKVIEWPAAFKTSAVVAVASNVIGFLLGLISPLLGLIITLIITFVIAMFALNKLNGIELGRSALMTLIGMVIVFVATIIISIVVAGIAVAAGMMTSP
jgi:hypothetical protein